MFPWLFVVLHWCLHSFTDWLWQGKPCTSLPVQRFWADWLCLCVGFLLCVESLGELVRGLGQQVSGPVPGFMGTDMVIGGFWAWMWGLAWCWDGTMVPEAWVFQGRPEAWVCGGWNSVEVYGGSLEPEALGVGLALGWAWGCRNRTGAGQLWRMGLQESIWSLELQGLAWCWGEPSDWDRQTGSWAQGHGSWPGAWGRPRPNVCFILLPHGEDVSPCWAAWA